jgi:hypothetical protein
LSLPEGKLYGTFLQISFSIVSSGFTYVVRFAERPAVTILREHVDLYKP